MFFFSEVSSLCRKSVQWIYNIFTYVHTCVQCYTWYQCQYFLLHMYVRAFWSQFLLSEVSSAALQKSTGTAWTSMFFFLKSVPCVWSQFSGSTIFLLTCIHTYNAIHGTSVSTFYYTCTYVQCTLKIGTQHLSMFYYISTYFCKYIRHQKK